MKPLSFIMLPFKGIYWHNIYSWISIYFSEFLS